MKRSVLAVALLLSAILAGCGGSSTTSATSGVSNRAFATNSFSASLQVVDITTDLLSTFTIGMGSVPTIIAVPPGSKPSVTLVFNSGTNSISVLKNSTETVVGTVQLPGATESIVVKDANTAYAALRNVVPSSLPSSLASCAVGAGSTTPGVVAVMDIATNFTVTSFICNATVGQTSVRLALPHRLFLSHNGTRLLVLSDNPGSSIANPVNIVDTTAALPLTAQAVTGTFDQPVWAAFSADDSTAFIMNCGPECGGSAASVQAVAVASATAGTPIPVLGGATVGLLNGNTLYVAGTPSGANGAKNGRLTLVDVTSGTPVVNPSALNVGDGFHNVMALGSNNKLFIGATGCTNDPNSEINGAGPTGCLTSFDTSTNAVVIDTARDPIACPTVSGSCSNGKGSVTGMAAINGRSVFYVVEGGQLRVFDTTTTTELPGKINIVGAVGDVKTVDQ